MAQSNTRIVRSRSRAAIETGVDVASPTSELAIWEAAARDAYTDWRVALYRLKVADEAWIVAAADLALARAVADGDTNDLSRYLPVPFLPVARPVAV